MNFESLMQQAISLAKVAADNGDVPVGALVVNEKGEKEEIPKAHMKAIFEFDIQQLREEKLKDILN